MLLRTEEQAEKLIPKAEASKTKKKESEKVLAELQAGDRDPLRIPESVRTEITRDCEDELQEILTKEIDAEAFVDLPTLLACSKMPDKVAAAILHYQDLCRKFFGAETPVPTSKLSSECRGAFFDLRATVNVWQNGEPAAEEIRDPVLLFDRLMLAWNQKEDPQTVYSLAARLHEMEPDLYEPLKAMLGAKVQMLMAETNEERILETQREIERLMDDAFAFGVDDPDLWKSLWKIKTQKQNDWDRADMIISDMGSLGALEPLQYFFSAELARAKGDSEGAMTMVEMALELQPENKEFRNLRSELLGKQVYRRDPQVNDFNLQWYPEPPSPPPPPPEEGAEGPEGLEGTQ